MGNSSQTGNEIGIFEDGDFYDQADLDMIFEAIAPYVPQGTHPTLNGIDGGTAPMDGFVGIESLLDMSIILPLVHPQQAVLYQVDDLKEVESTAGFGNTFLDALDASYCTFEGGDDPTLDPKYPDTAPTQQTRATFQRVLGTDLRCAVHTLPQMSSLYHTVWVRINSRTSTRTDNAWST